MQRFSIIGVVLFVFFYFTIGFSQFQIQENRPPVVKIVTPIAKGTFSWNSIIPYTIHVSDHEDGNSEYDEIIPTEVFLVVTYLKDSSEIKSYLTNESNTDYSPLVQMGSSTCFSCHRAKGTLIGPSLNALPKNIKRTPRQ